MILALALFALQASPEEAGILAPRELAWAELSPEHFDLEYLLPDARSTGCRDLVVEMSNLVGLRFSVQLEDGTVARNFADLARASRGLDRKQFAAWFERLAAADPKLAADWGEGLKQLLATDHLASSRWKPGTDHDRDGILTADSWKLHEEGVAPWDAIEREPEIEQAATVMFADTSAIKAAENDFAAYPSDIGAAYEEIRPFPGGHFSGTDERGNPFRLVKLYFRCELPLWYPDYECDLRILTRIDAAGRLSTDLYSKSGDFHFLAGRDVFLPLVASDGEAVGNLVVRLYGFDLDDVPDRASHRREALRGSLGNLRRRAEAQTKSEERAGSSPVFSVRGAR